MNLREVYVTSIGLVCKESIDVELVAGNQNNLRVMNIFKN